MFPGVRGFQGSFYSENGSPCSDSALCIQVCDFHRQGALTSETKTVNDLTLASLIQILTQGSDLEEPVNIFNHFDEKLGMDAVMHHSSTNPP